MAGPSSLVLQPAVSLKAFSARDNYRVLLGEFYSNTRRLEIRVGAQSCAEIQAL